MNYVCKCHSFNHNKHLTCTTNRYNLTLWGLGGEGVKSAQQILKVQLLSPHLKPRCRNVVIDTEVSQKFSYSLLLRRVVPISTPLPPNYN